MIIGTVKEIWRHPVKSMAGDRLGACAVQSKGIPGDRGWALRDELLNQITNGKQIPMLMQCAARYREEPANDTIPPVDITFPDGTKIGSDSANVNARLSEVLGKALTLWPVQPASNKAHYRRNKRGARLAGVMGRFGAFRALLRAMTSFGSMNKDLRETFSREAHEPIPDISILPPEILEFTSPLGTYFDAFPIHILTTASLDAMTRLNRDAVWDVRRFRPNFLIETAAGIQGLGEPDWSGKTLRIGTVELKCEIPTMRCGMTMQAQRDLPKDPSVLRSIVKDANQSLGIYASVISSGNVKEGDQVQLF